MHRLLLIGLNHTTAPLEVRETLAFSPAQRQAAVALLRKRYPQTEVVLLSTCNRVELYIGRGQYSHGNGSPHVFPGVQEIVEFLADFHSISATTIAEHVYHMVDRAVVEHLFSVASSLDSMVLGETQIIGQVRSAYDECRGLGATGPLLNPLFQHAIKVGKQVMNTTALCEGRLSVASVAVDYARRIFEGFSDKTVLSIGAGKMSRLVLQHFADLRPGRLLITNRDLSKAARLASRFSGSAVAFENLPDHLIAADIVITSTGSRDPIVTRKAFEKLLRPRRYRPIFIIDIALPRDIEPGVGELEGVYLYNLDDLQQVVSSTQSSRREAVEAARRIVAGEVGEFHAAHHARSMGPLIELLRQRYHEAAKVELDRTIARMGHLNDADRAAVEELTRRVVSKLLHDPIRLLRHGGQSHADPQQYMASVQKLLGGDAGDPASEPADGAEPRASSDESEQANPAASSTQAAVPTGALPKASPSAGELPTEPN